MTQTSKEKQKKCGRKATLEPSATERKWARRLYRTAFLSGIGLSTTMLLVWSLGWFCQTWKPELLGRLYHPQALFFHSRGLLSAIFGLFILGFGYQAFPRFKGRLLPNPKPAFAGLLLYLTGAISCLVGLIMVFAGMGEKIEFLPSLALGMMILGSLVFPWQVCKIMFEQGEDEKAPYDPALLFGALGVTAAPLIDWIVLVYGPVWGLTIKGHTPWIFLTAMPLIIGVCQRFMAGIYAVKPVSGSLTIVALAVLLMGLIGGILVQAGEVGINSVPIFAGGILLAGLLVGVNRWVFCKVPEGDPSGNFFRMAAANILATQLLALALWIIGIKTEGFQVAALAVQEHGAILGVGVFAVVGTTFRVVPSLTSRKANYLVATGRAVWTLLSLALVLRLAAPLAGALGYPAFPLIAASGIVLCLGLFVWAGVLGEMLIHPVYADLLVSEQVKIPVEFEEMIVSEIFKSHPQALNILIEAGFTPLKNPAVRAAMAPTITLRGAAERRNLVLKELKNAILENRPYQVGKGSGTRESLPENLTLLEISEIKGEIASAVYQRYGLDACCGGGKTLREASEAHQIPMEVLLEELGFNPAGTTQRN